MGLITLGIETSCDETGVAVLEGATTVRANGLYSQIPAHRRFGGVVPELAARRHLVKLVPLTRSVLDEAGVGLDEVGLIAVTRGPGLIGPLLVGLCFAKSLALAARTPIIGINHLEAHLFSASFTRRVKPPFLALIVSGGHTELVSVASGFDHAAGHAYRLEASTRDDAGGEALDKVAKAIGLPYPGGAKLEQLARRGQGERFAFPRVRMKDGSDDLSFSGLKTAALQLIRAAPLTPRRRADIAASFQEAVCRELVDATLRVARRRGLPRIVVGGGVAANGRLRGAFEQRLGRGERLFFPERCLCTDNALMVAYAGYLRYRAGCRDDDTLDARADLRIAWRR